MTDLEIQTLFLVLYHLLYSSVAHFVLSMYFPALEMMLNHAILEQETLPDNGNIGRPIGISEIRARCLYHVLVSRESMQL